MRYAVVGSRWFPHRWFVHRIMTDTIERNDVVITGGAPGVDTWAEEWARENEVAVTVYRADWERYGKAAGPIRNQTIVDDANVVLAFWDGKSRGTKDAVLKAVEAAKNVRLYVENGTREQR